MQNAQTYKAYKPEFTLGLIGAILSIHTLLFTFAGYDSDLSAVAAFCTLFSLATLILGFVGSSQLNKNNKSGGTLLTVAGGLSFFTCIFIGAILGDISSYYDSADALGVGLFHAIVVAALLLTGGIMALARKRPFPPPVAQGWPSSGHYPGQGYPPPVYSPYAGMPPKAAPGYPPQAVPGYPPYPPYPPQAAQGYPPYPPQAAPMYPPYLAQPQSSNFNPSAPPPAEPRE
jgi:hypothetical protein